MLAEIRDTHLMQNSTDSKIRPFVPGDANAAMRIACGSPEAAVWSEEAYRKLTESGFCGLVLVAGGEVAGFLIARCVADEAEILNLAVALEFRRHGFASALLRHALEVFRPARVGRIFLEVRESNRAAIRFYESQGFHSAGRREAYYSQPPEAAVCMAREFSD